MIKELTKELTKKDRRLTKKDRRTD